MAAPGNAHRVGDRWHVDETYVKVAGRWVYLYRAIDQFGQVIDVYASTQRDSEAARRFFDRAKTTTGVVPSEVITDRAPTYPRVLDEMWPTAWHHAEQYANNRIEADHSQLKRRLRPMRGIKTMTGLRVVAAGHAFVQNLHRGHYETAADEHWRWSSRKWVSRMSTFLTSSTACWNEAGRQLCGSWFTSCRPTATGWQTHMPTTAVCEIRLNGRTRLARPAAPSVPP
jgi:transposase-like protein